MKWSSICANCPQCSFHKAPVEMRSNGRLLAGAIPDARLEVFEGAGHLFLMTHPERAIHLLREFLG